MRHTKVTDAGRNAGSRHPENSLHVITSPSDTQAAGSFDAAQPGLPDKTLHNLTGGPAALQGSWSRACAPPNATANRRQAAPTPEPIGERLARRRRPRAHPSPRTPLRGLSILDPHHPVELGSGGSREPQFQSPGTALARCPAMQGRDEGS